MSIEALGEFIIVETPQSNETCLGMDRRPSHGTVVSVGPDVKSGIEPGDDVIFDDCDCFEVGDGLLAFHQGALLGVECDTSRQKVFDLVSKERDYQDRKWGGIKNDDAQTEAQWADYVREYSQGTGRGEGLDFGTRMVKTAALAVAALESLARKGS